MPKSLDDAAAAVERQPDPNGARALAIETAVMVLAAGLAEPDDLRFGHGLSAEDIHVAAALAEEQPPFLAITPAFEGEALSLAIETAAALIAMRWTTPATYRQKCLSTRDDADDILAVVLAAAQKFGAPPVALRPRASAWRDDLPDPLFSDDPIYKMGRYTQSPRTSGPGSGASPACIRGLHQWGPLDGAGFATCAGCGTRIADYLLPRN